MIQLQFLNYLLDSKDTSLILSNNLSVDFFSDYKKEFLFIKNHLDKYNNIPDKISFLSAFPNFECIKVEEPSRYLLDKLYEDKNRRELANTFRQVKDLDLAGNTQEALNLYMSSSQNLVKATPLDSVDIFKDTSRYDRYVEKTEDYYKFYVGTGFKELDNLIGGWDRNEELVTIAARPGVGKSWVLLLVALAAAKQGLKVGIYSGEMSIDKVGYRLDTLASNISNTKIIHGNIDVMNDYRKFLSSISSQIKGSIKVITPAEISGPAGVTALRAFIEKDGLDMLCVDQHSLLEDDRKGKTAVDKAYNISRDLKNLQVAKKIPIIAVSQQKRGDTEEGVDVSALAQADRIGQDSTVVLFLDQKEGVMTMTLAKVRDSVTGAKLKYYVDMDKGIWEFIPNEADATKGEKCEDLKREFDGDPSDGEEIF